MLVKKSFRSSSISFLNTRFDLQFQASRICKGIRKICHAPWPSFTTIHVDLHFFSLGRQDPLLGRSILLANIATKGCNPRSTRNLRLGLKFWNFSSVALTRDLNTSTFFTHYLDHTPLLDPRFMISEWFSDLPIDKVAKRPFYEQAYPPPTYFHVDPTFSSYDSPMRPLPPLGLSNPSHSLHTATLCGLHLN